MADRVPEIEALLSAATPEPLTVVPAGGGAFELRLRHWVIAEVHPTGRDGNGRARENAALFAAAPEALRYLIAELKECRAREEREAQERALITRASDILGSVPGRIDERVANLRREITNLEDQIKLLTVLRKEDRDQGERKFNALREEIHRLRAAPELQGSPWGATSAAPLLIALTLDRLITIADDL